MDFPVSFASSAVNDTPYPAPIVQKNADFQPDILLKEKAILVKQEGSKLQKFWKKYKTEIIIVGVFLTILAADLGYNAYKNLEKIKKMQLYNALETILSIPSQEAYLLHDLSTLYIESGGREKLAHLENLKTSSGQTGSFNVKRNRIVQLFTDPKSIDFSNGDDLIEVDVEEALQPIGFMEKVKVIFGNNAEEIFPVKQYNMDAYKFRHRRGQ